MTPAPDVPDGAPNPAACAADIAALAEAVRHIALVLATQYPNGSVHEATIARAMDTAYGVAQRRNGGGPPDAPAAVAPDAAPERVHDLKCAPAWFAEVAAGRKTAELRRDDRGFRVGDVLCLREYLPAGGAYTGLRVDAVVTHVVRDADGPWLAPGHCMLSFAPAGRAP